MSEPIKPALTPEQWAMRPKVEFRPRPRGATEGDGIELEPGGSLIVYNDSWAASVLPAERHGLAALALHGQPFGFTWEDVDALRSVARLNPDVLPGYGVPIRSLADRIAALLPPRTP